MIFLDVSGQRQLHHQYNPRGLLELILVEGQDGVGLLLTLMLLAALVILVVMFLGMKIGGGAGIGLHTLDVSRIGIYVQDDPVLGAVGDVTVVGVFGVLGC